MELRYDSLFQNSRSGATMVLAGIEFFARCWLVHQMVLYHDEYGGHYG